MCAVAAAYVPLLVIFAVHALLVAAVAVASLFAAVSEGEAEVPCSVDGGRAVPCLLGVSFLAGGFLAAGFLTAFLAASLLAAFLAAGFLAAGFLSDVLSG